MGTLEDLSAEDRMIVREVMDSHGYTDLTKTQELAFNDGILTEGNHLLVAETGNGKTLCAETVTKKHLDDGGKVAYLVPSRQLVRDKRDTVREWADSYDVRSGKQKYHTADVAVATFASFYRAVLQGVGDAQEFDLVVLDDFHEIYGSFLGPEIEKSISAIMNADIEIFAMSATIGNPAEIGEWLNSDVTVSPEGRQIEIKEEIVEYSGGSKKKELADFIENNTEQGPFLVFNFAKSWTESRAEEIAETGAFDHLAEGGHKDALEGKVEGDLSPKLERLAGMLEHGVAYHHSDLPNSIREYIEDLYYENKIGCLCATTTIAYGFDAPVQSVVVADIKRQGNWVGVWEYQQWIGRAARPGYGYDVGYAYTLTRHGDEVEDMYFEPRRLEPVKTHIEEDASFRKLVLELIANGWDTPDELEGFLKETLFWAQLQDQGFGGGFGANDQLLKDKLQTSIHWLRKHDFIEDLATREQFATTNLGSGAVEFLFDTFGSHTLTDIKEFDEWLTETVDIEPLSLTAAISNHFGPKLKANKISTEFEQKLRKEQLNPSDATVTAAIICWYWVENEPTDKIDSETGVDSSYIYSTAGKLAGTMDATLSLFASNDKAKAPSWLDTFITRIERGIRSEEVPLVETIQGMGRYRVRQLRDYVTDKSVPAVKEIDTTGSLTETLENLYKHIGDEQQFKDVLRGNVTGIGPATADSVVEFIKAGNDIEVTKTGSSTPELGSEDKEDDTGEGDGSTLDDWV